MFRNRVATLGLLLVSLWLLVPAYAARELPFAPARKKVADEAPIAFCPFENEAITARLETGWTLADQFHEEHKFALMKFIPVGDNPEWPGKMINVASYLGSEGKGNAHEFMLNTKHQCEKLAPSGRMNWDVLADTNPNDVMFEYSVKSFKDAPDQFEMQRIIKGRDGIYTVIYHVGNPDIPDAERQTMMEWLKTKVRLVSREQWVSLEGGDGKALKQLKGTKTASKDNLTK